MDAAQQEVDKLIHAAMAQGEAVAEDLRDELVRVVSRNRTLPTFQVEQLVRNVLDQWEPVMTRAVADAELAGIVHSMRRLVDRMPAEALDAIELTPSFPPRIPEIDSPVIELPRVTESIKDLAERNIVRADQWETLAEDARRRAFVVARENNVEMTGRIREAMLEELRDETSLQSFRERLSEIVDASAYGRARVENVYRTSMQSAVSSGNRILMQQPILKEVFPYWRFRAIRDSRTRHTHRELMYLGLNGTGVYRADDLDVIDIITPPLDFNCRCSLTPISLREASRLGISEAREWLKTGEKPPLETRLPYITYSRPAGFVGAMVA